MKIALFGSTGFIGTHLKSSLKAKNHTVIELDVRKDSWRSGLKDADAVVNLGGYPLFKSRWNDRIKALIHDSRVESTHKIVEALRDTSVKILVNASAIGIYGASERDCDESSSVGCDFLARVCKEWEAEALAAERLYNIRTVLLRTGIVLGKGGGALQQLLTPFKLGFGGPIGLTGSQSMSWIHLDDEVGLIIHAIEKDHVRAPLNAVAPEIVSNKTFAQTLGHVLHRPAFLPLPKSALRVMVGEAAGVIAAGQRVHPKVALETGYRFQYPTLVEALKNICG